MGAQAAVARDTFRYGRRPEGSQLSSYGRMSDKVCFSAGGVLDRLLAHASDTCGPDCLLQYELLPLPPLSYSNIPDRETVAATGFCSTIKNGTH